MGAITRNVSALILSFTDVLHHNLPIALLALSLPDLLPLWLARLLALRIIFNYNAVMQPNQMPPPPQAPIPPPPSPSQHQHYGDHKPKKLWWILIVGGLAIVLAVAGGIFYFVSSDSNGTDPEPATEDTPSNTEADESVDWELIDQVKASLEGIKASYDRMEEHSQNCDIEQFNAEAKITQPFRVAYTRLLYDIGAANDATKEHLDPLIEQREALYNRGEKVLADSPLDRIDSGECDFRDL